MYRGVGVGGGSATLSDETALSTLLLSPSEKGLIYQENISQLLEWTHSF